MSEDRIYSELLQITSKLGGLEESVKGVKEDIKGVKDEMACIKDKPHKRIEVGISALISTSVSAITAAIVTLIRR